MIMSVGTRRLKSRGLKDHLRPQIRLHRTSLGSRVPPEAEPSVRQGFDDLSVEGLVRKQHACERIRASAMRIRPFAQGSMLVGVWFNWPCAPLFEQIAEGIQGELGRWGYRAVFGAGGLEVGAEYRGIESLSGQKLDGLIILPASRVDEDHAPLVRLIRSGVPLILVGRRLHGFDTDLVYTSDEMAAEALVSHLIQLGHRRIGFAGAVQHNLEDRFDGFLRMMHAHGLPVDEAWIRIDRSIGSDPKSRSASRKLLSLADTDRPTAILCASASVAEVIARRAGEMGLSVPQDLSIAGFDEVAWEPWRPPATWLTTYVQPRRDLGQQSARLLMNRLRTREEGSIRILLEGQVVPGASTGPAPGRVEALSVHFAGENARKRA